jgi:hypothetical protein
MNAESGYSVEQKPHSAKTVKLPAKATFSTAPPLT